MAEVRWGPVAVRDLQAILDRAAQTSATRSRQLAARMLAALEQLEDFPDPGRVVPEYSDPTVRELILDNYRLVYLNSGSDVLLAAIADARRSLLRQIGHQPWDLL